MMSAGVTVDLELDRPVDPNLIRVRVGGRLRAYAVRDWFGWAIVAKNRDDPRNRMVVVDRYDPFHAAEPEREVVASMMRGLLRLAGGGGIGASVALA